MRFRLGNEIGESNYWEEEDKRICRVCEGETETWEWDAGMGEVEDWGKSWQEMAGRRGGRRVDETDRERKRNKKR